jgi:hypothetical protein
MELLGTFRSLYTLRYVPITLFVQVIFWTGMVYMHAAIRASSGVRMANVEFRQALGQVELCIEYLHEAGQSFQCAKSVAGILDNLIKEELGALKTKDPSKSDADVANDLESATVLAPPVPNSADVGNVAHLSGFGIQSSAAYMQFQVQPPNAPSWHEWKPGGSTRHPMEGVTPFSWASSTLPMSQQSYGASGTAPFYPPFGMGLGMRGGETLSSRPFSPYNDRQHQLLFRNLNVDPNFVGLQQQTGPGGPNVFAM